MSSRKPTAKEIFWRAIELESPADRESYLNEACAEDPELEARVERLLAAQHRSDSFLNPPPIAALESLRIAEGPGDAIGPYKLLQQIGDGGMGVVYMAEQTEPVERRMALKIIKPGMDTRQVIARFEAERQALAMMDHPNIAKVLGAGTTDSGRPYFVMELVKGVPITQFCDEQQLSPRERLELSVPVCQAVQHAHQKGIIHRDIKPSNVMVCLYDGKPVPKVIDFGVAKAIRHRLTEKTMFTQYGQIVGTVEYMSPEQAERSQLDIDTRSDIYSLGVLLYELLTGNTPFDGQRLHSAAFDEMLRIIREEEPPKPSLRLSASDTLPSIAANRHTEPQKLSKLVRGELDWIVMKAMEKDRSRRYETADAVAEDIRLYLADEPVHACPPSASYRFWKFARRNKLAVATTLLVVGFLVVSVVGASIAAFVFQNLADEVRYHLEIATTQQQLAEGNLALALDALDAVYLDAIGEDKLLGTPLSGPEPYQQSVEFAQSDLSEFEKELLRRGLMFYDEFARQNQGTPQAEAQSARAYYRVALLHGALEDRGAAENAFLESITGYQKLLRNDPGNHRQHYELAGSNYGLAMIQPTWADAKSAYLQAEDAITEAIRLEPNLADYYGRRSEIRFALVEYRQAQGDAERAIELAPGNIEFHLSAARRYIKCAHQLRDYDRAALHCQNALDLDPNHAIAHWQLGSVLYYTDLSRALEHLAASTRIDPNQPGPFSLRARIYHERGKNELALSEVGEAIRLDPNHPFYRIRRAQVHMSMDCFEEALAEFENAEQLCLPGSYIHVLLTGGRGHLHLRIGEYERAEADFSRNIEQQPLVHHQYGYRSVARFHLGRYEAALGDLQKSFELHPTEQVALFHIPSQLVASCPDQDFRDGLLTLAQEAMKSCRRAKRWSSYAELLAACGRRDEAADAYHRAFFLRLYPGRAGVRDEADDEDLPFEQGLLLAARGEFAAALATFRQREIPEGQRRRRFYAAMLMLLNDEQEAYQNFCRDVAASEAPQKRPTFDLLGLVVASGTESGLDPETIDRVGQQIWEQGASQAPKARIAGACSLRAGRYEEARERLMHSLELAKYEEARSIAYFWLAIVHHHLGNADESRRWYDRGVQALQRAIPSLPGQPALADPYHWLQWNVQFREASALLGLDPEEELLKAEQQNEIAEAPASANEEDSIEE